MKFKIYFLIILSILFVFSFSACLTSPDADINDEQEGIDNDNDNEGNSGSRTSTQDRINTLRSQGISGVTLQNMVMDRCEGIAPQNRPYIFNGIQDCYGFCRQVWNAILYDGSTHTEDYYPNPYNRGRWHNVSGGIPVGTYVDSDWHPVTSADDLLPGDLIATDQGHAWSSEVPLWHGGIYAGKENGTHYQYDNTSSTAPGNGAYKRVFYGASYWKYYYKPLHDLLADGGSVSQAATIMHPTNQAEVYMRGRDGQLYHSWQNYQDSDSWSSWYPFSGQTVGNPVATKQQNGQIVLFTRGVNGDVIRMTKYGSGWGSWTSLGGVTYSDPAVGQNADGRLQVFVRGTNNHIFTNYQRWNNSSSYSGWIDKGNTTAHAPTVTKNQNGRLQLFIRKSTNGASLYMKQQAASGVNNWTGWYTAGGVIKEAPTVINYNGCIYQFARGTTGYVYYRKQASPNSGSWTGWTSIGSTVATSPVAAGVGANGDLMIFIRGNDNAIHSTYFDTYWHGWQSQGGVLTSAPAVGKYSNGRLFIAARGNNGRMYIKRQSSSYNSTSWTGWWTLGDNVDRF